MTYSENTVRNIIREYLEDYNCDSRFNYVFGRGQVLICESNNKSSVSYNAVMPLINEYLSDYDIRDKFIIDLSSCSLLIAAVHIKCTPALDKKQKGFFDNKPNPIKTYPDNYCIEMCKVCIHIDTANNKEIGYITCSGEYCEGLENKEGESKSKRIFDTGFGENYIIG